MVYLVIPDNDTTFSLSLSLFFSTVFSTLTRQADVDFKGQLPIHVRSYLDEFANVGEIQTFCHGTNLNSSLTEHESRTHSSKHCPTSRGLYKGEEELEKPF